MRLVCSAEAVTSGSFFLSVAKTFWQFDFEMRDKWVSGEQSELASKCISDLTCVDELVNQSGNVLVGGEAVRRIPAA